MKRFIHVTNWLGDTHLKRMVNQKEIVAYLKGNPGRTEAQIYKDIYDFDRKTCSVWDSNKKYADCLRRALAKKTVGRTKALVGNRKVFIYFAI